MKRSVEIAAHVFFWLIFTAFVYMLCRIYMTGNPDTPLSDHIGYIVLLELIMGLIFFYVTFFGIPLVRKKKENLVILIVVLLTLLAFFAYPSLGHGLWATMSSVIPHIIIVFLSILFRKFSDSIKLENEKQLLLLQNTQSELALLKMQISPHFLFNTLNNIDYLISHDTERASNSISTLADILRYLIYDTKADRIPLSDEIRHIEDYIGLIRLRTSEPDYLKYNFSGNTGHLQIAPMIFLPLIENAYKHSSSRDGEDIIAIKASVIENNFYFNVNNKFDANAGSGKAGTGIGLNIVRRRLELIYPEKHMMLVTKENGRYNVELTLRLDEY